MHFFPFFFEQWSNQGLNKDWSDTELIPRAQGLTSLPGQAQIWLCAVAGHWELCLSPQGQVFKHSPPVMYTHQCKKRTVQGKEIRAAVEGQGKSKDKPTQRGGGHESSYKQNRVWFCHVGKLILVTFSSCRSLGDFWVQKPQSFSFALQSLSLIIEKHLLKTLTLFSKVPFACQLSLWRMKFSTVAFPQPANLQLKVEMLSWEWSKCYCLAMNTQQVLFRAGQKGLHYNYLQASHFFPRTSSARQGKAAQPGLHRGTKGLLC